MLGLQSNCPKTLWTGCREDFAKRLATQTGLCLGPWFIRVSTEGLAVGEIEFAHMLTPGERPSSTEIQTCSQT